MKTEVFQKMSVKVMMSFFVFRLISA